MSAHTKTSIGIKILTKDFIACLSIDNFPIIYGAILNSIIDNIDNDYTNNKKRKEIHSQMLYELSDLKLKTDNKLEYIKLKLSDIIFNDVFLLLCIKDLLKCAICSNDRYNFNYLKFENINFDIDTQLKKIGLINYSIILLSIINLY